jgi:hypothetical protein
MDGTRIRPVNNEDCNFTRRVLTTLLHKVDETLAAYMKRPGEGDAGEDQISLTDPRSRAMAPTMTAGVGYNVQLAIGVKHKLIAEQDVCNKVLDMGRPASPPMSQAHPWSGGAARVFLKDGRTSASPPPDAKSWPNTTATVTY